MKKENLVLALIMRYNDLVEQLQEIENQIEEIESQEIRDFNDTDELETRKQYILGRLHEVDYIEHIIVKNMN